MNETAGWRLLQGEVAVVVRPLVAVADQKHPATWCVCVCVCIPLHEAIKAPQKRAIWKCKMWENSHVCW